MGGAFLAAAVLARVGSRIGLPTIPLFILAGILLGPHTPGIVLVADPHDLEMLSALGLVLLLFYLGLEFHLDDLKAGGRRMALAGGAYLALNVGAGLGFGFALGWGTSEALVLAGVLGISSSAIVTKVLVDLGRIGNPETKPILGIIVVEDVFLALYLAALQPILSGADSLAAAAVDGGKAFGFLLVLALAARFGTKVISKLINTRDDELLVISFLGAAVLVAGISEWFGVADAIGAFMVGLMLGSTTSGTRILKLVHPLRDAFGAIFFFAFGLSINPGDLPVVLWAVLAAVAVTLAMNVLAGMATAKLYGFGPQATANISTTLVARGEFALILATMAAGAGLDERLAPFIAGYVLVLAVLAPLAAGRSHWLARILPGGRDTALAPIR
ncbi:cation:proton antiporter [Streptomyces sp. NBC_01260]|uniref:cation:proton antiporter n=1 Tax=unclassified Streptomyces TaxID=2593676 RepID=UPI000F49446F|nr:MULTISPECIES: cation:proton antiporter [unclassified Streptomyces]MCX4772608.1 cation:proton antiporter [Streptomyces sp. NBC_01285]ROQ71419.1 potassium/proton antiporter membrane subunit (CPA2 family) [Streptomyces sp. CEV 2-1]RPK51463.1 K(+)/H(+) antiporter YhaU [Streptomyces sp. ADI92-24]